MKILLLGDDDASLFARQAVPAALEQSALALATAVEPLWISSSEFEQSALPRATHPLVNAFLMAAR